MQLTESPDTIVEADRQALRDAGYFNRGIFDIATVAAFFAMSNRVASPPTCTPMTAITPWHGSAGWGVCEPRWRGRGTAPGGEVHAVAAVRDARLLARASTVRAVAAVWHGSSGQARG